MTTIQEWNVTDNLFIIYSPDDELYYLEDRDPDDWKNSQESWKTYDQAEHAVVTKSFDWEVDEDEIDPSDYYTYADKAHDQGYRRSEQLARWEY